MSKVAQWAVADSRTCQIVWFGPATTAQEAKDLARSITGKYFSSELRAWETK